MILWACNEWLKIKFSVYGVGLCIDHERTYARARVRASPFSGACIDYLLACEEVKCLHIGVCVFLLLIVRMAVDLDSSLQMAYTRLRTV